MNMFDVGCCTAEEARDVRHDVGEYMDEDQEDREARRKRRKDKKKKRKEAAALADQEDTLASLKRRVALLEETLYEEEEPEEKENYLESSAEVSRVAGVRAARFASTRPSSHTSRRS